MQTSIPTDPRLDQLSTRLEVAEHSDDLRYAEQEWLAENRGQYPGEWLAVQGRTLVSHGSVMRTVLAEARRLGVLHPLMVFVDSNQKLPFGKW